MRSWRSFVAYVPSLFWAGGLLYLGSRPFYDLHLPDLVVPADKLAHLALYGTLGVLAVTGWHWAGRRPAIWIPWLASLLVGMMDELHQRSVVTRSADPLDWLTDAVAITLAFAVIIWRRRSLYEVE